MREVIKNTLDILRFDSHKTDDEIYFLRKNLDQKLSLCEDDNTDNEKII